MSNINQINSFLFDKEKNLLLSKVNERVDIFYTLLISNLCKKNSIKCYVNKKDFNNQSSGSLFGEKEANIMEITSEKELRNIQATNDDKKNFVFLNYGLFLNKIDNYTGAFFTTTFGFKIPIWRLNLDMNLKYLSDYQAEHHFLMEGGISLNFNYIKQFVREDKVQLKLNIENYK